MQEELGRAADLFGPEAMTSLAVEWIPKLAVALVILLGGWAFTRALARVLAAVFDRVELDPTASAFVLAVVRFGAGIVVVLAALDQLGVNTTSILASLGVMGLTLGFAAQNTLSNVISGLFIFWDRPFVIGDLVEVDNVYGRVETITLRSTRLVTPDGRMLAIPNQVIANHMVASYTNFPHLRIDIPITVAVDTDLAKARAVLLSLVEVEDGFMPEPAPQVVVKNLNDYNVELELRAWIRDEKQHIVKRFALREHMFEAFNASGIDMPYETLELRPVELRQQPA